MNSLKKDFIERTLRRLEDLSARAAAEDLAPEFLREISRAIHTMKGTAQTFGFSATSDIAHRLEDLLAARGNDAKLKTKLIEGFAILAGTFDQPDDSAESKIVPDEISVTRNSAKKNDRRVKSLPAEISEQLSEFERKAIASASAEGREIFCLHSSFTARDFASEFKALRERLESRGEVIATVPCVPKNDGDLEFSVYFAADDEKKLLEISQDLSAEVLWESVFAEDDFAKIYDEIAVHAEILARESQKLVSVSATGEKIALSAESSNLIFEILLHLVRNAVDHGIETPDERGAKAKNPCGAIEISTRKDEDGMTISVTDDGKGIDIEKLRAKAVERDLLLAENDLTEKELLDLIFLHDFSTAETVTETSGRGVGLDAVKAMVENANGTIGVKSLKDSGTTFEIFLPNEA